MILLTIHIENFGKMRHYDMQFHDGINTILQDNGWGKSTLAAFIRVMFYGFENERKKKDIEKERIRFMPWQGGKYGGYIIYEYEGKKYRLERFFEKNNDTIKLYDEETNLEIPNASTQIGEDIFGINRESFSKTVFISL